MVSDRPGEQLPPGGAGRAVSAAARAEHAATGEKVRNVHDARYAAQDWPHERRVLIKAEVSAQGDNPRYVVTNLGGGPQLMYDRYARRGEMEGTAGLRLELPGAAPVAATVRAAAGVAALERTA